MSWNFGDLNITAAEAILSSTIPASSEASAIQNSITEAQAAAAQAAANTEKITQATAILQTFFKTRILLQDNAKKIAAAGKSIPQTIIDQNNALLSKTDTILAAAYHANNNQLLPYQPTTDIPAGGTTVNTAVDGFGSYTINADEINSINSQAQGISKTISSITGGTTTTNIWPVVIIAGLAGAAWWFFKRKRG